jgi:hypothetical protein
MSFALGMRLVKAGGPSRMHERTSASESLAMVSTPPFGLGVLFLMGLIVPYLVI